MKIRVAPAIEEALALGEPVVALESTLITHGLPRPRNLEIARRLENAVKASGSLPATIAVVEGVPTVGIDGEQLERLAQADAAKASLWNLSGVVARRESAGTTVAATLHLAAAAGIRTFATGGIGGVHREPFDESADLAALARHPVVTICSGPKSILDAAATLERLESLGVPVIGYRSSRLAGFHVPQTELPLPLVANDPLEIAMVFEEHRGLGLDGGMLVSNPVSRGLDPGELQEYLRAAERDAREGGVRGKELTPFLLQRLSELSAGRTVEVNLRLLEENAALAGRVAVALSPSNDRPQTALGVHHE